MACYNLISCNPSIYPDLLFQRIAGVTDSHPYSGKIVYINTPSPNPLETYELVFLGGKCIASNWLPPLVLTVFDSCATPTGDIFKYRKCDGSDERVFSFPSDPAPPVFKKDGDCDCWVVRGEDSVVDEIITLFTAYEKCADCLAANGDETCIQGERTLGFAVKVSLPDPPPPDRGFSKCCYTNLVLGDLSDTDPYKNDFTGAYFKRETPSSSVVFKLVDTSTLVEYNLNDATYGIFQDFGGGQDDLSFYIVEWRKVLSLLGAGNYQIKKELDIAGISIDVFSNTFTLKQFSIPVADKTVRIDSFMDGQLVKIDTNFAGTGYKTSSRLRGFFGRAEYSFEQDNIATRNYDFVQNTMSSKAEYQFQGLGIPECISEDIWNFILLGSELFISDYNGNNHSYKYEVLPVKLEGNSGTEFFVTDRGVNINLTFSDRTENNRKLNC